MTYRRSSTAKALSTPIATGEARRPLPARPRLRDHSGIEMLYTPSSLIDYLEDVEADAITMVLESADWNVHKAALLLGIKRTSLIAKMRRLCVTREAWEDRFSRLRIERSRLLSRQRFLDYFIE